MKLDHIEVTRTVAVLAVVGYHFFPQIVPGGFLGVDVFFILSGYLIARQIEKISPREFIIRRFSRLLPGLLVVLVFVVLLEALSAPRFILEQRLWEALYALTGTINFYFWKEVNYFGLATHDAPLLPLWSLAVEIQFYVVIASLAYFSKKKIFHSKNILLATSLLFCISAFLYYKAPGFAFYTFAGRAFLFSLGMFLQTLKPRPIGVTSRALVYLATLTLFIITPIKFISGSVIAIFTAALLATFPKSCPPRLATSVTNSIGGAAFLIYLFHFPLAIHFHKSASEEKIFPIFALVLACILLRKKYEAPLIRKLNSEPKLLVASIFSALVVVSTIIVSLPHWGGRDQSELNSAVRTAYASRLTIQKGFCKENFENPLEALKTFTSSCDMSGAIIVIGDSHGRDVFNALSMAVDGRVVLGFTRPACRPTKSSQDSYDCHYEDVLKFLRSAQINDPQIILHFKGSYFLTRTISLPPNQDMINSVTGFLRAISATQSSGNVYFAGPHPEPNRDLRTISEKEWEAKKFLTHHNPDLKKINDILKNRLEPTNIKYVDMFEILQNNNFPFFSDGNFLYSDKDHWSVFGERRFGPSILEQLQ